MAVGTYAPAVPQQYFDNSGNALAAGTIETFTAGTSVHLATYSDVNLTVPNANPMTLNAAGRPPAGNIFLSPGSSYKFLIKDVTGATMATPDNILAVPISTTSLEVPGVLGQPVVIGAAVALYDGSVGASPTGTWINASTAGTYANQTPVIGFATANGNIGDTINIRLIGRVTGLTGLVLGAKYYVGPASGVPAISGTRFVGQADSTTSLVIAPNRPLEGGWTIPYTPSWTNTGTANVLGNGQISGEYLQIGKLVKFTIVLVFGSTTTVGSGGQQFSLPVMSDAFGAAACTSVMLDSSATVYYGGFGANNSTLVFQIFDTSKPGQPITATSPFTWATGDQIFITGTYFAA